jgi:hypothetical protein
MYEVDGTEVCVGHLKLKSLTHSSRRVYPALWLRCSNEPICMIKSSTECAAPVERLMKTKSETQNNHMLTGKPEGKQINHERNACKNQNTHAVITHIIIITL